MSRAFRIQILVSLIATMLGVVIAFAGPMAAGYHMVLRMHELDPTRDLERWVANLNQTNQLCLILQVGGGVFATLAALYAFTIWAIWFVRADSLVPPGLRSPQT